MKAYKGKGKANNPIHPKSKAIGRVLIADDDADTVLIYKSALEKAGYGVITVDNGEDCAKAYMEEFQKLRISRAGDPINRSTHRNQPFEAVVLDYRMPQMNGMEVAKEILALNPHQRIIETVRDSVKELKQVVELLQKPFSYHVLLDTVSDKQIYNRLKKYNINIGLLKRAELSHEQMVEVLNILESSRKADQEEDEEVETENKQDG
jgi:DNA-binding NtrC family response regulator